MVNPSIRAQGIRTADTTRECAPTGQRSGLEQNDVDLLFWVSMAALLYGTGTREWRAASQMVAPSIT
eukprot:12434362-Alexandrium_andersonii.AAC.1